MTITFNRRSFLKSAVATGTALTLGGTSLTALAKDKPTLRFSAVFSPTDIRAKMMQRLAEAVSDNFKLETYLGGTLYGQGTELIAMQRGNLEMSNIAPQDFAKQIPEWSILTAPYAFRDTDHLMTFFRKSDDGAKMKKMVEDQLGVKILGPTFYGTRQVGLNTEGKIETPADMKGIKLRMPPGDAWQFMGRALGATPVPIAYAEVYTALATGTIDGQDNPLPNVYNMKFYEVMKQIVLTSHWLAFDLLSISLDTWNKMSPSQQEHFQAAVDDALSWSISQHLQRAEQLVGLFEEKGLEIYTPDVDAFRSYAQNLYLNSEISASWPKGMLERINAL